MNLEGKRVYVAGANGMVGSAIVRSLQTRGIQDLLTPSRESLDLRIFGDVKEFFLTEKPNVVVIAAAKVGGIWANSQFRGEFIYDNIAIASNVIECARTVGVEKLIFLGSSVIYPLDCLQPIKEEQLLTSALGQTNEPYAIAKIAGLKLCENYYRQYGCNFYTAIPPNLYGANDNFDLTTSHVIPALIRRFHEAKTSHTPLVRLWGTGLPQREFMYTNDLADAVVFLLENVEIDDLLSQNVFHINIGTGDEMSIRDLASLIASIVGYEGDVEYDASMPDGAPRKLLDHSRIRNLGWTAKTEIADGLRATYDWYVADLDTPH